MIFQKPILSKAGKSRFLGLVKPSKLNQEVNDLNRPITNEEIEVVIKSLPARK